VNVNNVLTAGLSGLFEVRYRITEPHTDETYKNRIRVSVKYPGFESTFDDNIIYEQQVSGGLMEQGNHAIPVSLPSSMPACEKCILQFMWASSEANAYFVTCADVTILAAANASPVDTGAVDECANNADCAGYANRKRCATSEKPTVCVRETPLSCLQGTYCRVFVAFFAFVFVFFVLCVVC
jgi:hypothetical protein